MEKKSATGNDISHQKRTKPGPPIPPDGGWGWVVMFSSFMCSVIVDGVCFSFGIFLLEFLDYYGESKMATSWVGSTLNGMYLTIGPIVGALANKLGCRVVAITGSVIAAFGFFVSTFSPNVTALTILYGAVGGLGFGLLYLPAIVMVGFYFEKKRAFATGVAVCGSGIGTFIFAPLSQKLLDVYNWQGATWIIAGVVLNGCIFGFLFRPLPPSRIPVDIDSCESTPESRERSGMNESKGTDGGVPVILTTQENGKVIVQSVDNGEADQKRADMSTEMDTLLDQGTDSQNNTKLFHSEQEKMSMLKNRRLELLKSSEGAKNNTHLSSDNINHLSHRKRTVSEGPQTGQPNNMSGLFLSCDEIWIHACNKNLNAEKIKRDMLRPLYRKDIFYSGSITNLPEYSAKKNMESYICSVTSIPRSSCDVRSSTSTGKRCCKNAGAVLGNMLDVSILQSPTFLIYGFSCFLCMLGFFVPFTFLPDHAIEMNINKESAAFLLSILGITNTVGRVLSGWLSDRPWADCLIINNCALLIGGIATMLVPFCSSYVLLAVYGVVFGICIAAFVSLRSIIMVELMGLERLTNAFGLVTMFQGLSSFIGAPIAGSLFDATRSYDISFYFAGATLAVAGIICFPLRKIAGWENRKLEKHNTRRGSNEQIV